jgi:hypothetical protein
MTSVQRRLNSTGRTRITRDRVSMSLEEPAVGFPWAAATLRLGDLDLPRDAQVTIEAYYRSSSMRFPCGTIAALTVPARMELTEIDRGGAIRFRVLVIASDGSGQILASAEGLRPTSQKGDGPDRESLLPLRETALGSELWKVDIDERTGPTLSVNNSVPGLAAEIRSSPLLQGVIFPHAFRLILQKLPAAGEDDEDTVWGADWRKFLQELGVDVEAEDRDDPDVLDDWVESAVTRFCELKKFASRVQLINAAADEPHV